MLLQSVLLVHLIKCAACSEDTEVDVDDILNDEFMPGSLLMLDGPRPGPRFPNETVDPNATPLTNADGTYSDAMLTMGFHRKMMNEYLCRNFVADQILEEMKPVRFKRRLGHASTNGTNRSAPQRRMGQVDMSEIKDSMLSDPGSSNYRDWLSKTTTLEDIYRHYGFQGRGGRGDDDADDEDVYVKEHRDDGNEEIEGDVTGYAIEERPAAKQRFHGNREKVGYAHSGYGETKPVPVHYVHPSGHSDEIEYTPHQHQEVVPQYVSHYHYPSAHGGKKDMILKDLFDIALTALAFLSFGVFAIQVVLCIAATKKTTTTTSSALLSMTSGSGYGTAGGYQHRQRRDVVDASVVNELARRVLLSMEAVAVADQDDGNCLREAICANNKYSRRTEDNQKIWIPVYGLALSWLSGRLSTKLAPAPAMLESLKAAVLGLGNADCATLYPGCDLALLREERRKRRRRKRDES